MIFAQANSATLATLTDAPVGLLPNGIQWEIYDPADGSHVVARTSVGIINPLADVYTVSFTAPNLAGSYIVRWSMDGGATTLGSEDLILSSGPPSVTPGSGILPTVQEIGNLLRARTLTLDGVELGTFANNTRPTGSAVAQLMLTAEQNVRLSVDITICSSANELVRGRVALYTAMLVETSYWPEQVADDHSVFANLKALYDAGTSAFAARIEKLCGGVDPSDSSGQLPASLEGGAGHTFPIDAGGMVGWKTRW